VILPIKESSESSEHSVNSQALKGKLLQESQQSNQITEDIPEFIKDHDSLRDSSSSGKRNYKYLKAHERIIKKPEKKVGYDVRSNLKKNIVATPPKTQKANTRYPVQKNTLGNTTNGNTTNGTQNTVIEKTIVSSPENTQPNEPKSIEPPVATPESNEYLAELGTFRPNVDVRVPDSKDGFFQCTSLTRISNYNDDASSMSKNASGNIIRDDRDSTHNSHVRTTHG
jgi:hypothetical protein